MQRSCPSQPSEPASLRSFKGAGDQGKRLPLVSFLSGRRLRVAGHHPTERGLKRVHGLTLSVAEILGRPGEYRDVTVRKPLPGVAVTLARLSDRRLEADLRIESVVEGVLVTGPVHGDVELKCRRCLEEFDSSVALRVCELFVSSTTERGAEDDVYRVAGTEIDLAPMLTDAVALALPLNPLCRPDCKGLCAQCGEDLNEGACDCRDDGIDPRWADLAPLRAHLKG
jgi:uncharacterized protein